MDGLLNFLQDAGFDSFETILPSSRTPAGTMPGPARASSAPGILFVDDFDLDEAPPPQAAPPAIIEPVFTAADVEAARAAGRQEGLEAARGEHHAVQAQLTAAALANIGDALAATRQDAAAIAQETASSAAAALLALLQAALPAASANLAESEINALLAVLVPALKREPAMRLTLHPDILPAIGDELARRFPQCAGRITLQGDAAMAPADAAMTWHDGDMRRDMRRLWHDVADALRPFALPSLETILKGAENGG